MACLEYAFVLTIVSLARFQLYDKQMADVMSIYGHLKWQYNCNWGSSCVQAFRNILQEIKLILFGRKQFNCVYSNSIFAQLYVPIVRSGV